MSKFEVGFSDVEGTPFRPFRVHAIRMPNGAIYDAVNGWRGDCPPPKEEDTPELVMKEGWWNRLSIEVANRDNGRIDVRVLLLEEDVTNKSKKWPEIATDYGEVELSLDMQQELFNTPFAGTILIARND